MSKWKWIWRQFSRRLWVRSSLIGILGIVAAFLATIAEQIFSGGFLFEVSEDAVSLILEIIAASMLTVTTFSLSVMTAAFATATSNVTPRATKLLAEDRVTQSVLSAFIGAFLFAIVALVALQAGAYGSLGRGVLFSVTIAVLALVVISLMRWIDHLTRFGRVSDTIDRVENETDTAITEWQAEPFLGGRNLADFSEQGRGAEQKLIADRTGYLIHLDMPQLHKCASEMNASVKINIRPGSFVFSGDHLASVYAPGQSSVSGGIPDDLIQSFNLSDHRGFDQDPRFGIVMLSEIAVRALSPGINDPGTAIDVIGRLARLLITWSSDGQIQRRAKSGYPNIYLPALEAEDMLRLAFEAIGREGATKVEVQTRLLKSLRVLGKAHGSDVRLAAHKQADLALRRSEDAMTMQDDLSRLREILT